MHKRDWALFIIVVWIAAGLRAYQIFELGGQSDEGVHVVVVQQLLRGADLYSELFENRTPGVFWLLTALAQLLPADLLTLRWVTWGMGLITTAGLWSLGRTLTRSSWGGVLAAVLYATAPLPVLWDRYVMLEPYVTAFTVLGMLAAVKGARNADMVSALLAGLFSGAAVLMKQSAVMMLPAIGLFLLVNRQQPRPIKRRLFFSWLSGGAGMALLLLLGLLVTDGLHPCVATLSGLDRLAGGDGIAVK